MAYSAKVLKDSIGPFSSARLTTLEVTFPRIVLAEFNTHRMFSRNSASSRAIPIEKMIQRVIDDPFIPIYWGKNQKGMQAEQEIDTDQQRLAEEAWLISLARTIEQVRRLSGLDKVFDFGVHKQITNRLLEPFMWQTVIVTATEWDNFLALRCNPEAQPEIRRIAEMMRDVLSNSKPRPINQDDWHLPLIEESEQFDLLASGMLLEDVIKVSVGRCARISYLTHDGKRDPRADVELCERLQTSGHMSPFEHVARPMYAHEINSLYRCDVAFPDGRTLRNVSCEGEEWANMTRPYTITKESAFLGNFNGWVQKRKLLSNEDNFANVGR